MALETSKTYFILQPAPKEIYCRLCLSDSLTSKYKQVFSAFNNLKTVAEMIGDLAQIEILENDNYSKLICLKCFHKLTATEDFKALILTSNSVLRQQFPAKDPLEMNRLDCSSSIKDNKNIINQEADIEIKQEYIEVVDHELSNDGVKTENIEEDHLPSTTQIRCFKCNETFKNYESRREHYKTGCKPLLNFKCMFCNKSFPTQVQYDNHKVCHSNETTNQSGKCGKEIKFHSSLRDHKFVHSETKLLNCEICNQSFTTSLALNEHKNLHSGESFYECDICQRRYKTEHERRVHKRQTHNPNWFECKICGKLVQSLTVHMKFHTKPYKCQICNQHFATSGFLKRHMTTHSDGKLYSCEFCKKEFKNTSTYISHVSTHTNKNKFRCEFCRKPFNIKAQFTRHLKNVHKFVNTN